MNFQKYPTKLKNTIYKIYSHNTIFLKSLTKLFFSNNYLKKNKNYIVILKSPHVHKKAQEHFNIKTHLVIFKQNNLNTIINIKQYYLLELILYFNNFFLKKKKIIKRIISFKTKF
jgi:hypothetical protein